ncbi:hypothetical protein GGF46_000872 [Coemansia sp. RSA 552]|nr:hypothetical protein GGF46_000872 [Coemansia sp. RSA 552]
MSTTLFRQSADYPKLEASLAGLMESLNIASVTTAALTLIMAGWCRVCICGTDNDRQRCRVVMLLSISSIIYSASQFLLSGQAASTSDQAVPRICAFMASLHLVFSSFLAFGAIGIDSAVRYGLRSFGLARRLSGPSEVACFVGAVLVSQPVLYLFSSVTWTGHRIAVDASQAYFGASVWIIESGWVAASLVLAGLLAAFTMAKANKRARYTAKSTNYSTVSILGTPESIRCRAAVSLCYIIVYVTLYSWRLAFRAVGSSSVWLLSAACICEAAQPLLVLLVFITDIAANIAPNRYNQPEWLSASTVYSLSMEPEKQPGRRLDSKSFTSWRKTGFLEWQRCCTAPSTDTLPSNKDIKLWMGKIEQCHIRPDLSSYHDSSSSSSMLDISFDDDPKSHSGSMTMHPLAK